jgi:hypothetical protein
MTYILIVFFFGVFGFDHVETFEKLTLNELRPVIEQYHNRIAEGTFNGTPPQTLCRLYRNEWKPGEGQVIEEITVPPTDNRSSP